MFKLVTLDTLPSSTGQVIYISGIPYSANATHYFRNLKLEVGNTATAWSPAPEDVANDITNAKTEAINSANSTLTTTIANYYTKNETNSQISATTNAITSRVSSLESTTSSLNNKVTNQESRLASAESKITPTAIKNTIESQLQSNGSTVIASKSDITQTVKDITFNFTQSGGANLVRNGNFKNGATGWWSAEYQPNSTNKYYELWNDSSEWVLNGTCAIVIRGTGLSSGEQRWDSVKFPVKANTTYTLSFLVSSHRTTKVGAFVRGNEWEIIGSCSENIFGQGYSGGKNRKLWKKLVVTFNSGNNHQASVNLIMFESQDNGHVWFTEVMVNEGNQPMPYCPHSEELGNGSTVIDATGITVKNGALRVKDRSGNMMLEGDSSGTLYLRKQLNVGTIGTFSQSGININGGSLSISGGTAYNESSTGYLEGSTTSQRLYNNGLYGSSSMTSGSQNYRSNSFYGTDVWSIYEDNSANAIQQSYKTYSRGSVIYIQATDRTGSLVEATRLNHEGLRTTGSITASNGVNADTLRSSANANNRIDLQSHNNDMWFRSTSEYFTFQCGTGGDNWTQSFGIRGVNYPNDGQNQNWIDFGQMKSNAWNGSYRGVSIRKYENGGATAGI